ncbi:MAG: hypothetical protein NZ480_08335 [Bdellovibrionaceae bacterium]|nr:hypothetical protein [Pseudobdellovibrionaceae bacterium]MDW8190614.1 hypothetical protein [Pseudobdellovibrionaceae bacterium]
MLISRFFQIGESETWKYFEPKIHFMNAGYVVRIDTPQKSAWSHLSRLKLIGSEASLREIFEKPMAKMSLEVRIRPPKVNVNETETTKERGNIKLVFQINLKKINNETLSYEIDSVKHFSFVSFSDQEAIQCLYDRFEAIWGTGTANVISPQVGDLFPDCSYLTGGELEDVAEQKGFLK